ncbi:MAG TPA: methylmalonyl-CoA mutase family protein, partial [Thermodesulfobacteriota bacterium]|nr:methylmalonyl-CoA mutase family protein [Thermodesulfobacteriota bacterium]
MAQEGKKPQFSTASGIPVQPLYTPADLDDQGFDYTGHLGFPGEYPFTRGID